MRLRRKRLWKTSRTIATGLATALTAGITIGPLASVEAAPLAAGGPTYNHVGISEEVICLSYTADFMRGLIALAQSNKAPATAEMKTQVKLAADLLGTVVDQAPTDFAATLIGVRTAFTQGYNILESGQSGKFTDPQESRAALLAYVWRCQNYDLKLLPGKLKPPEPGNELLSPMPGQVLPDPSKAGAGEKTV